MGSLGDWEWKIIPYSWKFKGNSGEWNELRLCIGLDRKDLMLGLQYFCKQISKLGFTCLLWCSYFPFKHTHTDMCAYVHAYKPLYACTYIMNLFFQYAPPCSLTFLTSPTCEVSWAGRKVRVSTFPWMLAAWKSLALTEGWPCTVLRASHTCSPVIVTTRTAD